MPEWQYFLDIDTNRSNFADEIDLRPMISGLPYDKKDGIQLSLGGGAWYLFYDRSEDFRKKHRWHEIRMINGILYWRNIGRLVFLRDVPIKYRTLWDNPKREVHRDGNGRLKQLIIKHA